MSKRYDQVDALRGLALMGILFVNSIGMAYGMQSLHLGHFFNGQGAGEQAAMFLVAFLFEGKFYPIFSFLFGASFALQASSMRALGPAVMKERFTARLAWLRNAGALHALFLFFGDILFTYAIACLMLRSTLLQKVSGLLESIKTVAMFLALALVVLLLFEFAMDTQELQQDMLRDSVEAFRLAGQGNWLEMAFERLKGFVAVQFSSLLVLPMYMALFMLGSLAVRLGWLTRPLQHRAMWKKVLAVGLVAGIPLNLWCANATVDIAMNPLGRASWHGFAMWISLPGGWLLAAAYVAAFVLFCQRPPKGMQAMGRMALSNYLLQSLLGMLLLQSPFLALGPGLLRPELLAYCVLVIVLQWWWSRSWLARHKHGPIEAHWRRHTRGSGKIEG